MTSRLVMTRKDSRRTDFVLAGDDLAAMAVFSSDTARYTVRGSRATTTITRTDPAGERFQVGVIEWPVHPDDPAQLVVGTRDVRMSKVPGVYTSNSERFVATDGFAYEWQIFDARPQLVPLRAYNQPSSSHVATFVRSQSGCRLWRRHTSSLFVLPGGHHILDDIIVTFIYFESRWRDKESARSRSSLSSPVM